MASDTAKVAERDRERPAVPAGDSQPLTQREKPIGDLAEIRRELRLDELNRDGFDGHDVAIAVVDTGINLTFLRDRLGPDIDFSANHSWVPSAAMTPGHLPPGHGTMCAFLALQAAPKAKLLDIAVNVLSASNSISDIVRYAMPAYGHLLELMAMSPEARGFRSLVVTDSWGIFSRGSDYPPGSPFRFGDNMGHPLNRMIAELSEAGADILFSAGNCGPECPDGRCDKPPGMALPPIFLPNAHPDVLTVAGVYATGEIACYSSLGGNGSIDELKPDVAMYTQFLGSEVDGNGKADSGTSAACALAAGLMAALRSKAPTGRRHSPAAIRSFLRATASGNGTWRRHSGFGLIETAAFGRLAGP